MTGRFFVSMNTVRLSTHCSSPNRVPIQGIMLDQSRRALELSLRVSAATSDTSAIPNSSRRTKSGSLFHATENVKVINALKYWGRNIMQKIGMRDGTSIFPLKQYSWNEQVIIWENTQPHHVATKNIQTNQNHLWSRFGSFNVLVRSCARWPI